MNRFREASVKANEIVTAGLLELHCTKDVISTAAEKHRQKIAIAIYGFAALAVALLFSLGFTEVVFASDPGQQVFQRANTAMQGVLRQVRLISSIIAALFLTLAFLLKMLSKNQRTVDEANTWIMSKIGEAVSSHINGTGISADPHDVA
jgi:hypothetical protein